MAVINRCPKCQNPVGIPGPGIEMIICSKCGANIKKKTPAANATPTASRRLLLLFALLGGLLMLGCLSIAGIGVAWYISAPREQVDPTTPVTLPKIAPVEIPVLKVPTTLPPPDPRIKIVQPAVDKGVAYLKMRVPSMAGMRCGYVGMVGLTLLECGVPAEDPAILQIAKYIRIAAPTMNQNYDLSPSLFFLNRWDEGRPLDERDRKMARSLALRVIAGQDASGMWSYTGVMMTPEQEAKLLTSLRGGTYKPAGQTIGDTSNTQFALLAVWGARKHDVPVRDPLLAAAAYFHANQHPDGHWHYPGNSFTGTATCAALISLALENGLQDKEFKAVAPELDNAKNKKKADMSKAFDYLAKTIGKKRTDPGGPNRPWAGEFFNADALGDLYFLWALERVGVIYSKEQIGGKDWYDWGYPILLQAQKPDGSWEEKQPLPFGPLIDTSFALLFLKRANIAKDLTEIIRTRDGKVISNGK